LSEPVDVKPIDPGSDTWHWLAVSLLWFQKRHGSFNRIPTMAFLPGPLVHAKDHSEILAITGSSVGRDIVFSETVLQLPYREFFITVFHELHEYRLFEAGGYKTLPTRPLGPAELEIERQAKLDWRGFCIDHNLEEGTQVSTGRPITNLKRPGRNT